ncbi:hypothetical protein GCM10011386_30020 [Parapedobacter defluvii]|uniref:Cytoplasmic protein n=1 Tax=Parapedobacter defluvii TaxID=2045106 RepID=A0ABQ1MBK4_9SPHI|nr:hypothetical protein [Parapedobacter defluvii]GGC35886.1 hypothetical protein GCM10011386_30020 [Parapedobacter defluvii]
MEKHHQKYSRNYLKAAHRKSSSHKEELLRGGLCGCFYCKQLFSPEEITEWIEEPSGGQTAICPKCGIDSVLGEELPIKDKSFLDEMNILWFG